MGEGPGPVPSPDHRQNVLELRKSPGRPTPLLGCQGRAASAQLLPGAPKHSGRAPAGGGGDSFSFQALTTLALSNQHEPEEQSNCTFPKLPGFGFQPVLPGTTPRKKESALPGNPLHVSRNKARDRNHLA